MAKNFRYDPTSSAHFSSMKIIQDVREYAAQKEIDEQAALGGMKEKAEEFVASGGEIYQERR